MNEVIDHKKAFEMACYKKEYSNIARSYLELNALLNTVWHCMNNYEPPGFPKSEIERAIGMDKKMADITMCQTEDCPLQKYCYRYQAMPNRLGQSYAKFDYKLTVMGAECEHFWQINDVQK